MGHGEREKGKGEREKGKGEREKGKGKRGKIKFIKTIGSKNSPFKAKS